MKIIIKVKIYKITSTDYQNFRTKDLISIKIKESFLAFDALLPHNPASFNLAACFLKFPQETSLRIEISVFLRSNYNIKNTHVQR